MVVPSPRLAGKMLKRVEAAVASPKVHKAKNVVPLNTPPHVSAYYKFMLTRRDIENRRRIEGLTKFDDDPVWVTEKYLEGSLVKGMLVKNPKTAKEHEKAKSQIQLASKFNMKQIKVMERDVDLRLQAIPQKERRALFCRYLIARLNRSEGFLRFVAPHTKKYLRHMSVPRDSTIDVRRDLTATLPNYLPPHMEFNWKSRRALHVGDFNTSGVDARSHLPERINGFWTMFLCKHTN
jgi:hypothetical protein